MTTTSNELTIEQRFLIGRIMGGNVKTAYDADLCASIASELKRLVDSGDDCYLFLWAALTAAHWDGRRQVASQMNGMADMVMSAEADIRKQLVAVSE